MKDWKEWFKIAKTVHSDIAEEGRYQAYKARLIEEGFIEANPKRWVRPTLDHITDSFISKMVPKNSAEKCLSENMALKFYNHWNDLDWYRGKTRMKSYGGSINTWIKNNEKYKKSNGGGLAGYDNESTNWG